MMRNMGNYKQKLPDKRHFPGASSVHNLARWLSISIVVELNLGKVLHLDLVCVVDNELVVLQ